MDRLSIELRLDGKRPWRKCDLYRNTHDSESAAIADDQRQPDAKSDGCRTKPNADLGYDECHFGFL